MLSSYAESGRKAEKTAIPIIVACALAAALFFVVPRGGTGEAVPTGTEAPASPDPGMMATIPVPADNGDEPVSVWPQAGFSARGNPAWGPGVREPFVRKWQIQTGYEFFSSPVLLDNTIFIGCNDMRFRALNAGTGEELWSRNVNCGLSGGAAADESRVWFGGQDGRVYCLDRESGRLIWETGLGYHVFSDAALFRDTVVLAGTSMGDVAALHARTGQLLWSHNLEGLVLGPAVEGERAVFVTESGEAAAFSPGGTVLWKRTFASQPSAPTVSDSTLYLGFSSGKVLAFNLETGATLWETQLPRIRGRTVVSRPVSTGPVLLAGTCDSRLVCLDRRSGEILWETGFENWVQVPPAVSDTMVYVSCDDGRLHVLSLNDGALLHSHEIDGYSGTQPVVRDGVIYLGTASGRFLALGGTVPAEPSP